MAAELEKLAHQLGAIGPEYASVRDTIAAQAAQVRVLGGPERFTQEPSRLDPSLEGKIDCQWEVAYGGFTKQELLSQVERIANIGQNARFMSGGPEFRIQEEPHTGQLVAARVDVLVPNPKGRYATTKELDQARNEKGLEPVSPETAHLILLQHEKELKIGDVYWMSMDTIAGRDGGPGVFGVGRDDDGLWLRSGWTDPDDEWDPDDRLVFALPQVPNEQGQVTEA